MSKSRVIGEDREFVAQQVVTPLLDSFNDGTHFTVIRRAIYEGRSEGMAEERDRSSLLLQNCTHCGVARVCLKGEK